MKTKLALTALAVAFSALPIAAQASDGTVTFTGTINGATCNVSINNAGPNATVSLPSVAASKLATKGSVAGGTNFTIELSGCTGGGKSARAYFEAGPNVDGTDGTLINRAATDAATNVAVQLLGMDGLALKAGDSGQRTGPSVKVVNNSATLSYGAQYYAKDAVKGGGVSTSVTYAIEYL
ncbi:fimbrial protein [Burkholderia cepacia]|uniref:Fimbrial protein n=1 Tax=Burkholderia cepacia GG4 TaxID=1009846 RepID=A0A9W3JW46_BURCE|nr:fimbrial protein [Burkholderia cepacia]AFQ46487.1 Fimbrial protein [Burkholderia cepacia GG4]